MKKNIFLFAICLIAISFTACKKDKNDEPVKPPTPPTPPQEVVKEAFVDASSYKLWHYYSLSENKIVGSAEETPDNNAVWGARKDWDIAFNRFNIRTNSGEFTKADAKGGAYVFKTKLDQETFPIYDPNLPFASVKKVPNDAVFATDKTVTVVGHSGSSQVIQSEAKSTIMKMEKKKDEQGNWYWSMVMPPKYMKAPLTLFRNAEGNNYYKVEFTQYVDQDNKKGQIKFNFAKIEK